MTEQFARQTFNRQLVRAIALPLVLLVTLPFAGFWIVRHLADVVRLDRHSVEVIAAARDLEKSLIDLETGVRGFQLTGDNVFLQPYDAATQAVGPQFDLVQRLVADSPDQMHRIELVRRDFDGWSTFAGEAIHRVRQGLGRDRDFNTAGKILMDHTRSDMADFLGSERDLLDARARSVGPAKETAIFWMASLFVFMMAAILWWTWVQMRTVAFTYQQALTAADLEKERFRVTLASIGDAVIVTDRNGTVTFLNSEAERLTGWNLVEAQGHPLRTVFRIINEQTRLLVDDPVERVFRENRVVGLANHTVLISKNGSEWMIEDSASPILDADRKVCGVVLVFQDAGVRRAAQRAIVEARDQAVAASQAKDDFLAALSHELRTPLNPVLLLASENSVRPDLSNEIRQDFSTIAKNILLESRLIDDLLDLTRITNRKLSLDLETINAHTVLHDALEKVAVDLTEKGLQLDLLLQPGPAWVKGDDIRLQQVFWNVLRNAVKFTPRGGRISVTMVLPPDGGSIAIAVADTGLGLTSEELKTAFEPFTQGMHADRAGAHRFGGLGLGLAIARSIVELHSGRIEAVSPGRDQGATFTIKLPLADAPAATSLPSIQEPADASGSQLPPYRILLVEDHEATRTALAALLRKRGCQVITADRVATALAAAEANPFDLVVSDIGLPDGDGLELMRILRQQHGLQGIATSGFGQETDIAKSKQAGFHDHLTKPIMISRLEAAILSGPWAKSP